MTAVLPLLSMSTSMFTMSFGAPSALHDMACDQYSSVSKAFDKSVRKMSRFWDEDLTKTLPVPSPIIQFF